MRSSTPERPWLKDSFAIHCCLIILEKRYLESVDEEVGHVKLAIFRHSECVLRLRETVALDVAQGGDVIADGEVRIELDGFKAVFA